MASVDHGMAPHCVYTRSAATAPEAAATALEAAATADMGRMMSQPQAPLLPHDESASGPATACHMNGWS